MAADPRVDRYIKSKPAFAHPILRHLRKLVHEECPQVVEDIKWGRPVFLLGGKIIFNMAAFTAHCGFGFWNPAMQKVLARDGLTEKVSSGSLGKLTRMDDLPPREAMVRYIREALRLEKNPATSSPKKKAPPKPEIPMPAEFAAALKENKPAAKNFETFNPSQRREYLEWITETKRTETRDTRIATSVEWLAAGKVRHWKYT